MCTLSFVHNKNGCFLTHNRDENKNRKAALVPKKYVHFGVEIIYPRDEEAGGTWIASSNNFAIALLNGAFKKHERKLPYKKSRGLVLLDFFEFNNPTNFFNEYNFNNIEPCTIVIVNQKTTQYYSIYLSEHKKEMVEEKSDFKIYSSVTLYSPEWIEKRELAFNEFIAKFPNCSQQQIIEFHTTPNLANSEYDFIMQRPSGVETLSVTSIEIGKAGMGYLQI